MLQPIQALEQGGYRVTYLGVDREGLLNLAELENALDDNTALVSLMAANNETGVLFPVREIGALCREREVLFHCDAVQMIGKLPFDVSQTPADYVSITGHKFHAPKGVGALYVRSKAPFTPLLYGGHQERGRRGGTENVALIAALGKAAELAKKRVLEYEAKVRPLRDTLENVVLESVPCAELNGHPSQRLPNTSNISFHGVEAEALLLLLDREEICASSGSACLADSEEPSHVIGAMKPETDGRNTLRFSLGMSNTMEEVGRAVDAVQRAAMVLTA